MKNCLNLWAQRVVFSGKKFSWRPGTSGVLQERIVGLVLLSSLTTQVMGQSAPSASLQIIQNWEDWLVIQSSLDKLEKWTSRNLMKFNNGKCKVLNVERNNPRHQDRLGTD